MDNYGKGVAEVLQELISGKQVLKVQISRFIDDKLVWESEKFTFGHEFIHVGSESYALTGWSNISLKMAYFRYIFKRATRCRSMQCRQ